MNADPIIEDLRDNWAELVDSCNGDIDQVIAKLRDIESNNPSRMVRSINPVVETEDASGTVASRPT
jgi:hypothetical protein